MRRITAVKMLPGYRVDLTFDDGVSGVADLSPLVGRGVFAAWKNQQFFEQVRIGTVGELVWDDTIDLCPNSLYLKVTGKQPEEIFPALRHEHSHA